jgi:hemolysin activation/secretion protein
MFSVFNAYDGHLTFRRALVGRALAAAMPVLLCGILGLVASPAGAVEEGTVDAQAAQVAEAGPRFDVWEYRIEGSTVIPRETIERTVYPYLGPQKTIDDVEAARAALEKAHRDAGYGTVLVDLPEQDVVGGIVLLSVVEGKVDRLKVSGSRYFSLGRIKSGVPSLAEGQVPYLPDVQKQLQKLNMASQDRAITPVLRPGRTPGKLEVELKVKDELPVHASLELNDRFTNNTERLRLNADLRYDNLWQREHAASVGYQVAPQNREEVEVFSGTYALRPFDGDTMLTFYGVKSASDVAAVGTLGVVGDGTIGGVRATLPLAQRKRLVHNLTLGFDYKDFGESIDLLGADSLNTPISYSLWSASCGGTHFGEQARSTYGIGVNFAQRGLGNTTKEFENKRFRSKPNFAYLIAYGSHVRALPHGMEIFGGFDAQVADSPLISNEQFSIGGVQSVRAYLESQAFTDNGVRGSIEFRSPDYGPRIHDWLGMLRAHAFIDAATGNIKNALPGQIDALTLWSAGIGFRLAALDSLDAEFDWAVPFESSGTIEDGESRVHFTVRYGF